MTWGNVRVIPPNGRLPEDEESPEQLWHELEKVSHRLRRAMVKREAQWQEAAARARKRSQGD